MLEQKTIDASEVSNRAMVNGNEAKYPKIIIGGIVKEWIGFGWIDLDKATSEELKTLPMGF